jgi:putative ubiquitin-RnfH superfamily antitoxin RatB of RatAB toxin-antitoxin module
MLTAAAAAMRESHARILDCRHGIYTETEPGALQKFLAHKENSVMNVGICYAEAERQLWMRLEIPDGSTVQEAINLSGVLMQFPEIDLSTQKVGIFGKIVKLDTAVQDGDRVEIYRQITADPKTVKRRRVEADDDD